MITATALETHDRVAHGFFTRQGGVSSGIYGSLNIGLGSDDERVNVLENRARAAARFALPADRLLTAHQHHSADVLAVEQAPWPDGAAPKGDAMVTDRPGILLGILTADCGPVLFSDNEAGVIGAAHAGWRGALTGVLEATLDAMERLGARRERVSAVLGPTISADAYEVGDDFKARFEADDPANSRFFRPSARAGHAMFDLPGYILARLERAGTGSAENLRLCTYANEDDFYSYRRTTHRGEPDYGRLVSAITLRERS